MKKKLILAAIMVAVIQGVAVAGFVDMTAPRQSSGGASARIVIDESYQSAQWDRPVSAQTNRVSIPEALAILLPTDLPGLRVHMDPALENIRVHWDAGLSRREALASTLPPGMLVKISGGSVHVSRVVDLDLPAQGYMPGGSGTFMVRLSDRTLRQTISRWAPQAGWSFEDAYWAIDRDIPVVAASAFNGNFKDAVLGLMATTEVTDMPAKPCFYTNNVVRIVPKAEKCDKTKQE